MSSGFVIGMCLWTIVGILPVAYAIAFEPITDERN